MLFAATDGTVNVPVDNNIDVPVIAVKFKFTTPTLAALAIVVFVPDVTNNTPVVINVFVKLPVVINEPNTSPKTESVAWTIPNVTFVSVANTISPVILDTLKDVPDIAVNLAVVAVKDDALNDPVLIDVLANTVSAVASLEIDALVALIPVATAFITVPVVPTIIDPVLTDVAATTLLFNESMLNKPPLPDVINTLLDVATVAMKFELVTAVAVNVFVVTDAAVIFVEDTLPNVASVTNNVAVLVPVLKLAVVTVRLLETVKAPVLAFVSRI